MARLTLSNLESAHGPDNERLIPWLLISGTVLYDLGKYEAAEELFRKALRLVSEIGEKDRPQELAAKRGIARVQLGRARLAAAEISARHCVALSEELFGSGNALHAEDLLILARVLIERDRFGENSVRSRPRRTDQHGSGAGQSDSFR